MESHDDLARRVANLERQLGVATGRAPIHGIRRRASWGLGDIPFYDIALGPDLSRGEIRGHAKGVIAIGDVATGVVAIGGVSRGFVAIGGLAAGLISLGGLSIGVFLAVGGLAIGSLALGGAAAGGVALGGGAAGYYACGGAAVGAHTVSAMGRDAAAEALFRRYGLAVMCGSR